MALVDFLTAVDARLKTLAERVYYSGQVPPREYLPYVHWRYTTTTDMEDLEDFFIEVEITDEGTDATRIEGIVAAIDGDGAKTSPTGMHRWHYGTGGSPTFRMFRINRTTLPAIDENIQRRLLRYRARAYL